MTNDTTVRQRQKKWLGHVMRCNGLIMDDVLEGRMDGKRPKGGRERERCI